MMHTIATILIVFSNLLGGVSYFAAQGSANCPQQSFFSLPSWHKYLPEDTERSELTGECEVEFNITDDDGAFNGNAILLVGLAIIDILIRVAGLVSFGFIVYGGFRYITSQGSPENTKSALGTIINAIVGLVVALLAAAIVSFIGYSIG